MRYIVFFCLLLVGASGQSHCPTTYEPVVDEATGLPFYNDCIARRQLLRSGTPRLLSAKAVEEQAARRRLDEAGGSPLRAPTAADIMKLLPAPTTAAEAASDTNAGQVSQQTMDRYADEGFFYVGRPGFLNTQTKPGSGASPSGEGSAVPLHMHGARVSLRISYPEGDLYMKIWTAQELVDVDIETGTDTARTLLAAGSLPTTSSLSSSAAAAVEVEELPIEDGANARHHRRLASHKMMSSRKLLDSDNDKDSKDKKDKDNKGGKGNSGGNGGNGGQPVVSVPRYEVLSPPRYPYTAVSQIQITKNLNTTWCSGALVGPTGRLVMTAAHCIYEFDQVAKVGRGYYPLYTVTPGSARVVNSTLVSTAFRKLPVASAEVLASFLTTGSYDFDVGLLRLAYHFSDAGTLSFSFACPLNTTFAVNTAGYPADTPVVGSLWRQRFNVTRTACSTAPSPRGSPQRNLGYTFARGQNGSSLWTDDNVVRWVATPKAGTAVAITQTTFNWITSFTLRNIINIQPMLVAGGGTSGVRNFIKCNITTRTCVGSNVRAESQPWQMHPIGAYRRSPLRALNQQLCLTLDRPAANSTLSLKPCNLDGRFTFAPEALWTNDVFPYMSYTAAVRSDVGGSGTGGLLLKFNGVGQPLTAVALADCMADLPSCSWGTFVP